VSHRKVNSSRKPRPQSSPSSAPAAIFIDLDGTLADSLVAMRVAYQRFLKTFGAQPTDREFAVLNGPPLPEVVRRLKGAHSLAPSDEALLAHYLALVDDAYARSAPTLGAEALLACARDHDCIVGVVTSSSTQRATSWLERVSLLPMVAFVVSGDDVRSGKPDPEPYLLAARLSARPLSATIAVEDSVQGAQSAVTAGLRTYVITAGAEHHLWPSGVVPLETLEHLNRLLWPSGAL
jgi:HAD superfamily hydrolase (TIGR01509 family)